KRPFIVTLILVRRVSLNHGHRTDHGNPQGGTDADTTSLIYFDTWRRRLFLPGAATSRRGAWQDRRSHWAGYLGGGRRHGRRRGQRKEGRLACHRQRHKRRTRPL